MKTTINYKGLDLDIEYSWQPYEKAETGPEAQYPGCHAHVEEISEIMLGEYDLLELLENDIKELKDLVYDNHIEESQNDY